MDDKFLEDLERTTLAENGQLDWRLELRGMAKNTRINYMSRLGFFDKYMRKTVARTPARKLPATKCWPIF